MRDPVAVLEGLPPALGFSLEEHRRRLLATGGTVLVVSDAAAAEAESGPFDAAWIAPSEVAGLDVTALGRRVAAALRPGAPVACSIPGCRPLPALLERALRGTGELPWTRRERFSGSSAPCLSAASWRRAFGPSFSWRRSRAFGVLVPTVCSRPGDEEGALLLGALAAVEHVVGSWPVLRTLGARVLLEGVRR